VSFSCVEKETRVSTVALSSGGEVLAQVLQDRTSTIHIWDTTRGEKISSFNPGVYGAAVAFSPDGKILAHWAYYDRNRLCRLWDVSAGKVLRTLAEGDEKTEHVAFAPDGKTLVQAVDSGRLFRVRDVATGAEVRQVKGGFSASVGDILISPDG